ncbi:MAG: fluoride exporter, partial [Verrucomicrobiota bacterium]
MDKAFIYMAVAFGSALGGAGRFWLYNVMRQRFGEVIPTLAVNVSGSFVIGFVAAVTGPEGRWAGRTGMRTFFAAGLCGGYTTFSAFSLQTLQLA